MQKENIISLFKSKGYRATPQRIAVYDYVYEHRTHPDALQIYKSVIESNPSFSKTTVYNALNSLCENGFIVPVTIDGVKTHFDANTNFHGHFICERCKEIYDFEVTEPKEKDLSGFKVNQKDVYYSGICPACNNK